MMVGNETCLPPPKIPLFVLRLTGYFRHLR